MRFVFWNRSISIVLLTISLFSTSLGQSPNGVLSGRVLDRNGEVIAKASLVLKNNNTGTRRRAESDDEGRYWFVSMPPGNYTLTADKDGFVQNQLNNIQITVASESRADISLDIPGIKGGAVDVNAPSGGSIKPISTESAALGDVVTRRQVVELPLISRNVYELIALSAGTAPSSDSRGIGIASNGQRANSGNYVLDGGENNDVFQGGVAQSIPLDAIQEIRVITNQYTSEYGRTVGFNANVISSAGTNDLHGSLYNFIRNSALAANTYNNNANGIRKPVFNRNQFGGTVGGRILKNKLFFLGSVEETTNRSTGALTFLVPTQDIINRSSFGTQAIFQRYPIPRGLTDVVNSTVCLPGFLFSDGSCNVGGLITIPAFGSAIISGNINANAGLPLDALLASGRLDFSLNERTQIYGRYSVNDQNFFPPLSQPYSKELDQANIVNSRSVLLNLVRTWSNNLITESRFVYALGRDEQPATTSPGVNYKPIITTTFGLTLPSGTEASGGVQHTYQAYSTASLNKGDHLFKFGGQYIHIRDNRVVPGLGTLPRIQFLDLQSFANGLATLIYPIDPKGKNVGEIVSAPFDRPSIKRHFHYNEFSFFFQDTWQISERLTIAPGLRWEYFGVLHSASHEKVLDSNFYFGEGSNVFERIANGTFLRTSEAPGKYKGHFFLPDYNNFAPRLAIAWDVFGDGKNALRSGVGMFYDRNFGNTLQTTGRTPPSYFEATFLRLLSPTDVRNPTNFGGVISLINTQGTAIDANLKTAYTIAWNFGIEHQLKDVLALGITYVGSAGNKLYTIGNINKVNSGIFLGRPISNDIFNDTNRLAELFGGIGARSNFGHSTYHALQVKAESGNFKNLGLQFSANYTFSHSIDNISTTVSDDQVAVPFAIGLLDPFNPNLDRGDSDFDVRHRFVTNFVWDLPFGLKSENWLVKNVLAGWGISGIFTFQTGQPFSIYDSTSDFTDGENPRPKFAGKIPEKTLIPTITPNSFLYLPLNLPLRVQNNCFSSGPLYCSAIRGESLDGTISRNIFRRPGTQYHNLAVLRNFSLPKIFGREGARLQLRGEFFSVFNHPNLYINPRSNDIANQGVTVRRGINVAPNTLGLPSFIDNRQIVIAAKFIF